jgi:ABC-type uncharacterized transport system permease subunit
MTAPLDALIVIVVAAFLAGAVVGSLVTRHHLNRMIVSALRSLGEERHR